MALPVGISTATVTVGVPVTFSGLPVRTSVTITPSVFLVHTVTGHPLVNMIEEATASDGVAVQFTLPHTDQDGFQDEAGNAYKNWYYTAAIQYSTDKATKPAFTKVFQLASGQSVVDLDLLPGGNAAMPYTAPVATVTAFNGRTGAVSVQESDLPERLSDTALNATILDVGTGEFSKPKLNTVVLLGDSITFNNGGVTGWWDTRGWFFWANTLLNGRLNVLKNAGISSNTTAQMLARIQTDVLSYNPGWVIVLGGTNDAATDIPATTTIANLTAIYNAIVGNGGQVVAMTITPRNGLTAARAKELATVNQWIKAYAQNNRGIYLCDVGAALVDTTASGYQIPVAYAPDGLHPNATGAARMGRVLAATLEPLVPKSDLLMNGAGPDNLIPNPYFNGSGSTMPAGWGTQGGTPTDIAYVPRTDGIAGSWLQVTLANGTAATNIFQNLNLTADFVPGDKVIFAVEVQCDTLDPAPAPDTQYFTAWIQFLVGGAWTKAYAGYWEPGYGNVPFPGTSGVFVTNPVVIPAGTTTVQAVIGMKGGGKYRVHRATARKVLP